MSKNFSFVARGLVCGALALGAVHVAFETYVAMLPMPDLGRAERQSTIVLSADHQILKAYLAEDEIWRLRTRPRDVPAHYLAMLLAYEDQRFLRHGGIDMLAVLRASYQLVRHRRIVSGASTLTMQVVRLLEKQEPGWLGKLRQAAQAVKLERRLDKEAILSLYLTLAPFGGNIEGVRAASLLYFGSEPRELSTAQAALLVAIPQAPERRRPGSVVSHEARDWVLTRMQARGVLSAVEVTEARREPIPAKQGVRTFLAHHLSDRLRSEHPDDHVLQTSIDRLLQTRVETLASEYTARQADRANVAVLIVRKQDMAVRAYLGGASYFDAERAGMFDLVRAIRSPGSALKPIIYGLAFEDLIVHPSTIVVDSPIQLSGYAPENFDRKYRGEMLIRDALIQSVNTVPVMLLDQVGPDRFVSRLRNAGVTLELPEPRTTPGLAIALGGLGISLERLVKLFAGLGNHGIVRAPRYVNDTPSEPGVPLMSPAAAWAVTDILADMPPERGRTALRSRDGGRRIAYKTGTSYGFKDAWSIGYDAEHVVAVWVGRPDGISRGGETGAGAAVPIMMRLFDLLPQPERDVAVERPINSVLAQTGGIPERLLRYAPPQAQPRHPASSRSFEIRFPVDGSSVRLSRADHSLTPMTAWVSGGKPPFHWFVDGRALTAQSSDDRITWRPDSRGQVEFVVIDSTGARARSTAWID
jgi:penicillin-binding protein 1C